MKTRNALLCLLLLPLLLSAQSMLPVSCLADPFELTRGRKILVVASYHKEYQWCQEIIQTLKDELSGAELTVFYMDTKRNLGGAAGKAKEAFDLYQKLQPDAVVTIDDNAQKFFVVPYLRDKVKTPVFFCGVNDDASKYGFPASNVTGVLEKTHYRESISFAQIIEPKVKAIGVLYRPTPSNQINLSQIEKEKASYTADVSVKVAVNSLAEAYQAIVQHSSKVDAFLLLNMTGIVDENNHQIEGHEAVSLISETTDLVTIGASDWEVSAGALCGVVKTGQEQGALLANQVLATWGGTELKDLPIVENKNGQRYMNLSTMKKLEIKLRPEIVIGTKIVTRK